MSKSRALIILSLSQVAVMSLWFTATAVAPALGALYGLSGTRQGLLTSAVQLGFVIGSLASAWTGLADRFDPRRIYLVAALTGAAANALFLVVEPGGAVSILLRLVTGAVMAGVYPIGMKIAMSWERGDAGLLVGTLVGALTLGSAAPHLFYFLGGVDWRFVLAAASSAAALGGLAMIFVETGPRLPAASPFKPGAVLAAWRIKPLRFANLGYFGHMWELYAVWAWIGAFLAASFAGTVANASSAAKLTAFLTVGIGAIGCAAGGAIADRIGRTTLTMGAMAVSALCCLLAGFAFGAPLWAVVVLCSVWGIAIVADSPQFSTSVAELSPPSLQGTMLTMQTAVGFALSLVTIQALPWFVEIFGWRYAFMPLAIGPVLGIIAMGRLRAMPEAVKLANGRR